ncbi:MAG: mycofactocin precursor MftA [Firmicutes bacterium]|nr:mycofactocin precursor [Alicyclobacillaceae bacterium]MCL6497534.1 mycofactocin precursor MftA [Bacillota bacterium]
MEWKGLPAEAPVEEAEPDLLGELLVEELSIDCICGVY